MFIEMNKSKFLFILFCLGLITILLVGCNDVVNDEIDANPLERQEGTYRAASDVESCGYLEAEITIEGGNIVEVNLTEYDNKGQEKGEEYELPEWHEAMAELPERIKEANSTEIDTISSATKTSERTIQAVDRALERSKGFEGPFDGIFMGVSDADEKGWGIALVRLSEGEITNVILEEIDEDGEFKDEDYEYDGWHNAKENLKEQFIEENSSDVDAYSGATNSSQKWMEAVERAIEKAEK